MTGEGHHAGWTSGRIVANAILPVRAIMTLQAAEQPPDGTGSASDRQCEDDWPQSALGARSGSG
jgi:hypothetical protein